MAKGTNLLIALSNLIREEQRVITDDDHELVSACKRGDVDAFEVLVRRHQTRMFNIAYRMVGNYDDACEIVQDAFVAAYRKVNMFKAKSKFSTWLCSIVINLSRNRLQRLRKQRHREPFSTDDLAFTNDGGQMSNGAASAETSALERLEKQDLQHKVQGCIDTLDPEYREVLILRDIQGFSYDEISDMSNIPEGTVKSRLFRARGAVKDCLKKVIGDL